MSDQPNFLVFIVDQMRADWMGCAGHPLVKTPNIDAIAGAGTRFTDFHVALPICMPNRASLMTGRMPSVHGVRFNGVPLPSNANTFVDVLAEAGYDTALIGKSHLQPFTDHPPLRKADTVERLIPEALKPGTTAYIEEEPASYAGEAPKPFDAPYYGFQHVDMVTGHGDRAGGHYDQWLRRTHPEWKDWHDPANELAHDYTCSQAYRTPVPEEAYPTAWIGNRACDYLSNPARADAPFFAFVSFPDPHHPFNPPGKYWDMYDPDDFDIPVPYAAHQNPPLPLTALTEQWETGETPPIPQMAFRASDRHVREAMALTAGMITMIDDQIGKVMEALRASGQYDNTVVIFTSDHGDYLGAFNLMLKGPWPHHSITRVPFIWSDPQSREAAETDALASTIDLSASILARASLAPYFGIQGESFLETLTTGKSHRDSLLIEHNDSGPRMGFDRPARVRTLRTKDWRLSLYKGEDWGELYDLQSDPDETRNLWNDPAYQEIKGRLALDLAEHLIGQMDECPRANRLA